MLQDLRQMWRKSRQCMNKRETERKPRKKPKVSSETEKYSAGKFTKWIQRFEQVE